MKYIKDVLIDLSILLSYDLEPCKELIAIKHCNINGISYPIFKECLFDYLDKTEIKLNTMFFVEQSSYPIEAMPRSDGNAPQQLEDETIKDTVTLTNDVGLLVTHRSLFILKKKFEMFKQEIKKIYKKYSEESIDDHLIDINNFVRLSEEVMTKAKFMLVKAPDFKELTKKEMQYVSNVVIDMDLLDQLNVFVTHERRKYNVIYRDKRMKVKFTLEDYKNYTPIGDDDLTKVCIEEVEVDADDKDDEEEEEKRSVIEGNKDNDLEKLKEEEKSNQNQNAQGEPIGSKENEVIKYLPKKTANETKKENQTNLTKDPNTPISVPIKHQGEAFSINSSPLVHSEQPKSNIQHPKKTIKVKRTYQKNFLFIETLPLILADFLATSLDYAICDLNDDIRGILRTLFDNEILQRLGEATSYEINRYKTERLKDFLFAQANVVKNIAFYELLLLKKKADNDNYAFIAVALEKLAENKKWLDDKIKRVQDDNDTFNEYENALYYQAEKEKEALLPKKHANTQQTPSQAQHQSNPSQPLQSASLTANDQSTIPNDQSTTNINDKSIHSYQKIIPKRLLTKEAIRFNALKEIFYFYSRQHCSLGKQTTFDSMRTKMDHLDLSEFSKFCVEFKILITKDKLVELFKKNTSNTKQMSFEEFNITLQKISLEINEEKKRVIKKRLIHLKNIIESNKKNPEETVQINQSEELKADFPVNLNNITLLKENQIKEEIANCKANLEKLNRKTYQQLLDELFLYMDLDQEVLYKNKMKGFNLPFLNKILATSLPPLKSKISRTVDKRSAREIHQMIEDRKRELQEQKSLEIKLRGMDLEHQKKFLLGNINKNVSQPLLQGNQQKEVLTVKQQKEIRELQRKKKEKDKQEFNKKIKRVFIKAQNEQKEKEGRDIDTLTTEREEDDEENEEKPKTIEEKQEKDLNKLLQMKQEVKVGNKFTWEALDKLKPSNLVDQRDMKKYFI